MQLRCVPFIPTMMFIEAGSASVFQPDALSFPKRNQTANWERDATQSNLSLQKEREMRMVLRRWF